MENQTQQQSTTVSEPSTVPVAIPSTAHSSQNSFLVILLSILLLISVSIAGFFAYQTQKLVKELNLLKVTPTPVANVEPTIEPVASADPTANWKVVNGKYWSFKVPASWYYIKCLSGNDIILGPNLSQEFRDIDSDCNFGISDLLSISRVVEKFSIPTTTSPDQNGIYTIVSNKRDIFVDKQKAIQQTEEIHGNPSEGTHTAIYIERSGYTDMLTFWNSNKNIKNETIDQILSTFKFIN